MLVEIHLHNFGIISSLHLNIDGEFNTLIGDSGSGKSLIVKALGILKGDLFYEHFLGQSGNSACIQACFNVLNHPHLLEAYQSEELIITRKLIKDKSSQAFINDERVSTKKCVSVVNQLLFISSQDQVQLLKQNSFQLELFDCFCKEKLLTIKEAYQQQYSYYQEVLNQKKSLSCSESSKMELDDLQVRLSELEILDLKKDELEQLKDKQKRFQGKQVEIEQLNTLIQTLPKLEELQNQLESLESKTHLNQDQKEQFQTLFSSLDMIRDLSKSLSHSKQELEYLDEEDIKQINERLDAIFNIKLKYKLQYEFEIFELIDTLKEQVERLSQTLKQEEKLVEVINSLEETLKKQAKALLEIRNQFKKAFESSLETSCRALGFLSPKACAQLEESGTLNAQGNTSFELLFTANPDYPMQAFQKSCSGGEKSRLLLAFFDAFLQKSSLKKTIIFDEIDQGIGGDIAKKMGVYLKKMSSNHQLICITHLSEIAKESTRCIEVSKMIKDKKTIVSASSSFQ